MRNSVLLLNSSYVEFFSSVLSYFTVRHDPCGASFMNGPVEGENVFIPLSQVGIFHEFSMNEYLEQSPHSTV